MLICPKCGSTAIDKIINWITFEEVYEFECSQCYYLFNRDEIEDKLSEEEIDETKHEIIYFDELAFNEKS